MSDHERCGRPLHRAAPSVDPRALCLMHSRDPEKDIEEFGAEIVAIRGGTSRFHRPTDRFDFVGFVFPIAPFAGGAQGSRSGFERVAPFFEVAEEERFYTQMAKSGVTRSRVEDTRSEGSIDDLDPAAAVVFTRDVDFTGARFVGQADFTDVRFNGQATFTWARFEEGASFEQAVFLRRAHFEHAVFQAQVTFHNAIFAAVSDFTAVQYQREVLFDEVVFNGSTYFDRATFKAPATFSNAGFNEGARFQYAAFNKAVDFSRSVFSFHADFVHTSFAERVTFDRTVFSEAFRKQGQEGGIPQPERVATVVVADFTGAAFEQPSQVCFRRVNRENPANPVGETMPAGFRARFVECDVSAVRFDSVRWHREDGRLVLQDEIEAAAASTFAARAWTRLWNLAADSGKIPQEDRYELIALAYRQLVTNFERNGDYDLAEDCYCGAMEMTRLDPLRPLLVRALLGIYRWASTYGSSYPRAFGILIFLMLLTAAAFALPAAGIARVVTGSSPSPLTGWPRLPASLFHVLEVASFQRDSAFVTTTLLGRLVTIFTTIVLPAQLALFLLAVRRRFRR